MLFGVWDDEHDGGVFQLDFCGGFMEGFLFRWRLGLILCVGKADVIQKGRFDSLEQLHVSGRQGNEFSAPYFRRRVGSGRVWLWSATGGAFV